MKTMPLRKKFEVMSYTPPAEPIQQKKPSFKVIQDYDSYIDYAHSKSHALFITSEAMKQIFNHIGWGKRTGRNIVEQGGILLGQVFRDENRRLTYGVAEAAVAGSLAKGSSASLDMTHETWKQMLDSVDVILNENPGKNLQVIGWYHTHPNELPVFMSGTDQSTQRRLFSHDWQFAIVLNPHKQIWKAFYGRNSDECRGFVIDEILDSGSLCFPEEFPVCEVRQPDVGLHQNPIQDKTTGSNGLKNFPLRLWHWVKNLFREKTPSKTPRYNQKRTSLKGNRLLKVLTTEMKVNFFIWLFGAVLLLILALQIVNLYMQFLPRRK